MTAPIITQEQLKSQLDYNSDTGIFTRLVSNHPSVKIGDIAGTIHKDGYNIIYLCYGRYRAHRLAWLYVTGKFPEKHIDHINGIKSDNRFVNLREANDAENSRNRKITINNKSGFKGVSWSKHAKRWVAFVRVNSKRKNLGYFETAELASEAYNNFTKQQYGEFYYQSSQPT